MRAKHHARSGFRKAAGATLVLALGAAVLAAAPARADGEDYGAPGPYGGQPQYLDEEQQGQPQPQVQPQETYQPPPENLCYDENNQPSDCSNDADFASYNQIDDGYDPQAYQDFEQTLSPYGSWVDAPSYGRVWVPSQAIVGADFTPYYSGGRWSYTDYGWTWASDYDWGWAPFHYGRWTNVAGYGWSWIPGRIWGPAWVHWRHGGGYVGWAPLPPRGFRIPAPIGARAAAWSFVPTNMMGGNRLVRVDPYQVPRFYHQTMGGTVIRSVGQTRVIVGPPPAALSLGWMRPAPLRSLQVALPRAQVTVGAGVPLHSRPYLGGHPGWGGQPGWNRPGFQPAPVYNRPGFQPAPTYNRPGFQPATPAPVYNRPGFQPAPVYNRPAFQPTTPAPVYNRPAFQPPPAPTYNRPAFQPPPAPTYNRPAFQPPPAPTYNRPAFQPPPAPTFHPAPAPTFHPAPAPTFHPAPAPTFHPVPAPTFHPAPAPTFHPAPTPSRPAPAPHHR